MNRRPDGGIFIWALEIVGHSFGDSSGDDWRKVLLKAGDLITSVASENGGESVSRERSFRQHCWGFPTLSAAIKAAHQVTQSLPSLESGISSDVSGRSAIHFGIEGLNGGVEGSTFSGAFELKDLAHPHQILVSDRARIQGEEERAEEVNHLISVGSHLLGKETILKDVYQYSGADLPEKHPALISIHSIPNNLEPIHEIFVDREEIIAELTAKVHSSRLVTLIGNRGIGKSSVAKRIAQKLAYDFKDGIFLIDFSFVLEPTFILEALAVAITGHDFRQGDLLQSLKDNLRQKQVLLIFDNCDNFRSQIRALINDLTSSCRRMQVLATCREGLEAKGEVCFEIPPIDLPPLNADLQELGLYDSVRLFVRQAQRYNSSFDITPENAPLVRDICRMVQGVPLPLVIAGCRAAELPLSEVKDQLKERGLTEFALVDWREASLQALSWAYDSLSLEDQTLLQEFSVIPDSFDPSEIEEYCSLPPEQTRAGLKRLQSCGLLQSRESYGFPRIYLCEAIRSFAQDKASPETIEALRARHAKWTRSIVERAPKEIKETASLMNKLALEVPNIRCALEFMLARHHKAEPLEFLFAIGLFWFQRGYISEGRVWTHRALSGTDTPFIEEKARGLNMLGNYATAQGDLKNAYTYFHHGLSMARQVKNKRLMAMILTNLGNNFKVEGNDDNAASSLHQSLELYKELGDEVNIAKALNNYAAVLLDMGMFSRAEPILEQSLEIFEKLGDTWSLSLVRHNLAEIAVGKNQTSTALQFFSENLSAFEQLRDVRGLASSFKALGVLEEKRGRHDRATILLGAAATAREQVSVQLAHRELGVYESCVGNLQQVLGKPKFDELWAQGRSMTTASAVRFALDDI